jgi:mycofactocin precursor
VTRGSRTVNQRAPWSANPNPGSVRSTIPLSQEPIGEVDPMEAVTVEATETDVVVEDEQLVEDELLVEEVSIDGMCGVY